MDSKGAKMQQAIAIIFNDPETRDNLYFEASQLRKINNTSINHRLTNYHDDPDDRKNKRTLLRL